MATMAEVAKHAGVGIGTVSRVLSGSPKVSDTTRFRVQAAAEELVAKLAGGHWTHDYALTAEEARQLGLPVTVGMPLEFMELMKLYPQPVQRSGVEFLPIEVPRKRQM